MLTTTYGKPVVPESVARLDLDVVVETLSRHGVNVSEAADELGVASADLRRLLWARPQLTDAAVEIEERRLDLAERNIYEALKSDDPRRRDAASMFTIRNSHRARRRGWITTSTSAAELSVTANAPAPHTHFSLANFRRRQARRRARRGRAAARGGQAGGQHWMGRRRPAYRTRGRPRALEQGLNSRRRPYRGNYEQPARSCCSLHWTVV
jgi:hypothetical protein